MAVCSLLILLLSSHVVCVVPTVLDLTVGFTQDSAEPTLLNIIQGRRCVAEMHVR